MEEHDEAFEEDLHHPLGSGGSLGEVRLVRRSGGRLGAARQPSRAAGLDADADRLADEIRAWRSLEHPGLLTIFSFDVGGSGGFAAVRLVSEYADAGTLEGLLRRRAPGRLLEPMVLLALCGQLAEALAFLHERSFVHRDVKPSNVFLLSSGRAKLGDPGACKAFVIGEVSSDPCEASLPYAAPEVLGGAPPAPPSDAWSLGAVWYEAASLRKPFGAPANARELEARIAGGTLRPLEAGGGEASVLGPLVAEMLEADASIRAPMVEILQCPFLQLFAASPDASAACIAALLQAEGCVATPLRETPAPRSVSPAGSCATIIAEPFQVQSNEEGLRRSGDRPLPLDRSPSPERSLERSLGRSRDRPPPDPHMSTLTNTFALSMTGASLPDALNALNSSNTFEWSGLLQASGNLASTPDPPGSGRRGRNSSKGTAITERDPSAHGSDSDPSALRALLGEVVDDGDRTSTTPPPCPFSPEGTDPRTGTNEWKGLIQALAGPVLDMTVSSAGRRTDEDVSSMLLRSRGYNEMVTSPSTERLALRELLGDVVDDGSYVGPDPGDPEQWPSALTTTMDAPFPASALSVAQLDAARSCAGLDSTGPPVERDQLDDIMASGNFDPLRDARRQSKPQAHGKSPGAQSSPQSTGSFSSSGRNGQHRSVFAGAAGQLVCGGDSAKPSGFTWPQSSPSSGSRASPDSARDQERERVKALQRSAGVLSIPFNEGGPQGPRPAAPQRFQGAFGGSTGADGGSRSGGGRAKEDPRLGARARTGSGSSGERRAHSTSSLRGRG